MSSFPILDLVVGIIFIYFLLSIICSSAVELCVTIFKSRAFLLEVWLKQTFNLPALDSEGKPLNVSLGQAIMDHCMVTVLSKRGRSTTYIDPDNFVSALLDKITISPATTDTGTVQLPPANLNAYITAIQNSTLLSGELKRTILSFANEAVQIGSMQSSIPANIAIPIKSQLEVFRGKIKNWYNTSTARITGTFKQTRAYPLTIVVAVIMVICLNTDSIEIGKYLYNNHAASKELAATALSNFPNYKNAIDSGKTPTSNTQSAITANDLQVQKIQLQNYIDSLQSLDLPLGWKAANITNWPAFFDYSKKHIAGWIATILAIMMGAPFWFDILNKISNLRSTGPKPPTTSDQDLKDD